MPLGRLVRPSRRRHARNRGAARETAGSGSRPNANALLRLVADLDALESKWALPAGERTVLGEIRRSVSAIVGAGIETAVRQEILGQLRCLDAPGGLSDERVEVLEETARHTRRLGIAGAKLGLASTPDSLLSRFLPTLQEAIRARPSQRDGKHPVRVCSIRCGSWRSCSAPKRRSSSTTRSGGTRRRPWLR